MKITVFKGYKMNYITTNIFPAHLLGIKSIMIITTVKINYMIQFYILMSPEYWGLGQTCYIYSKSPSKNK